MDFPSYAEQAAALLNTRLGSVEDLTGLLEGRDWLHPQCTSKDVNSLRRFQRELRGVFEASDRGDGETVTATLNELMTKNPITPRISDHDPEHLHLHVATKSDSVARLLIGESLLGLATTVCDLGSTRLGVCRAEHCENVFVDTSPNGTRRYCSDRCSSRANVAAFRARQRERQAQAEQPALD